MDYNNMMSSNDDDDFDGVLDMNNKNTSNLNYCSKDSVNNNNSSSSQMSESQNSSGLSKAELRKSNKPIMEKRRRARINHCLNELKTLILEAMKKDPARHTKLEKADILEMTVKHLQSIQRHQLSLAIQTDPNVIHRFKTGFTECAEEVNRYISKLDGIEPGVRQRLSNHLNNCSTGLEQIGTFSNFSSTYRSNVAMSSLSTAAANQFNPINPIFPQLPQDLNNNNNNNNNNGPLQMGGVQLIPSRLPSGDLALIMPNSSTMPFFIPNLQPQNLDFSRISDFQRMSAFTRPTSSGGGGGGGTNRPTATQTTATTTTTSSPPLSPVSSISSLGDDSMHTSSDFINSKTPPLQGNQSFSNAFPTPPSTESTVKFISHIGHHLQQPHVSSTSETQLGKVADNNNRNFVLMTKKRLNPDDADGGDGDEEPSRKMIKLEHNEDKNGNVTSAATAAAVEQNSTTGGSNDMWRPW